MHRTTQSTETAPRRTYRISIAPHLAPDVLALAGVSAWTTGYDADGLPFTSFLLEITGQADLLRLLTVLSDPNWTLLAVEWVRAVGAAQGEI